MGLPLTSMETSSGHVKFCHLGLMGEPGPVAGGESGPKQGRVGLGMQPTLVVAVESL